MNAILDTGPWVALIDRSEKRHAACVKWLKDYSRRLYSTEAVLTEVLYIIYLKQGGAFKPHSQAEPGNEEKIFN
jgi:predicted nucleic acid-binding protein